jgi:TolB protein
MPNTKIPVYYLPVTFLLLLSLVSSAAVADLSEHRPVCSNDGSKLIYMLKSEQTKGDWELYLKELDSQVRSRLTNHPGWDGYAVWSPDDSRIIFDREDAPGLQKRPWIMDLVKRTTKPLGSFDGRVSVSSWSPDNQLLGFQELDGKRDLILLDLTGKIVKNITATEEFNESDADFSPDGNQIAYASANVDGSQTSLELIDIESSGILKLHTSIGRIYGVTWSLDGKKIAFVDAPEGDDDDADVFYYDLEKKSVRQVTTNPAWDHMPEFCNNRPTLFFTSYRSGEERIYQIDPDPTPFLKIERAEK